MRATNLDKYMSNLIELPMQYQELGECDLCGHLGVMRPVIYNGDRRRLCWECIYRIREGIPLEDHK